MLTLYTPLAFGADELQNEQQHDAEHGPEQTGCGRTLAAAGHTWGDSPTESPEPTAAKTAARHVARGTCPTFWRRVLLLKGETTRAIFFKN